MFDQLEFKPKSRPENKKLWHDGLSLMFATFCTGLGAYGVWAALVDVRMVDQGLRAAHRPDKFSFICIFILVFGLNLFVRGYEGMDFLRQEGDKPGKITVAVAIMTMIASGLFGFWVMYRVGG